MADALLDSEELSIPDFVQLLSDMVREASGDDNEDDGPLDDFTRVALTGRHPDRNTQIVLNGQGNVLSPAQKEDVDQLRDYDSLLGATMDLPYNKELHVYLVPPFKEALKNKVHIRLKLPKDVSFQRNLGVTRLLTRLPNRMCQMFLSGRILGTFLMLFSPNCNITVHVCD